ncbi:MAG: septal ring lytic transglycosylase RlpA family protein [Candidatus Sumerlaeota bacterium]|nr:septal ring lytic transglycosylase RlpA family protein [Candidatus Sumerlaeota bacterium]
MTEKRLSKQRRWACAIGLAALGLSACATPRDVAGPAPTNDAGAASAFLARPRPASLVQAGNRICASGLADRYLPDYSLDRATASPTAPSSPCTFGPPQRGTASWYGAECSVTANGESHNLNSFTAAHRWLPFNSLVKVTNLENGRWVLVRVNNRGPFIAGRIIDLSPAAAKALGFYEDGVAPVEIACAMKPEAGAPQAR